MSVKAFELVPVMQGFPTVAEKVHSKIECIECCGRELYTGTNDSFIVTFDLEEKHVGPGKVEYNTRKARHKFIEQRKAVKSIKAASALNRILVLCDTSLVILNMSDLNVIGGGPRLRGVITFGINENPNVNNPFCIQICVARKKQLQIYNVTEDKFASVKEISLPEPAVCVAVDGSHICAALHTQYAVYNFETDFTQQLFTYGCENFLPIIRRITKEEFLLSAPEDLGMFVNAEGMSNRPPVQWTYPIRALAYSHPYILGLSDEFIMVYSILDQQQKQTIPFTDGRTIGNFDGRLFVSSGTSIYGLTPVPWEKQVEMLLADSRVEEALDLAENANRAGMSKEQFLKLFAKIQQQAAFIYFSNSDFSKARELFYNGEVDPREVISIFPGLIPPSSTFNRSIPPLHGIADVNQLFHNDEQKIKEAKQFLQRFLEDVREGPHNHHNLEVDTALLKLYAESNASELEAFIVAGEITCDIKDCCEWLEKYKCYHAMALLYRYAHDNDKALQVWAKIISGEYKDDTFHGLEFFVECLANLKEHDLLWRYADFVLTRDEEIGVKMFTLRSPGESESDTLKPESIVDYLHQYPKAVIKYLEYLVLQQQVQVEKYHTHLAILYLEEILKKQKAGEEGAIEERNRLQHLLQTSNLYRVPLLLGKIRDAELYQEASILYGKIEEHEKALDILIHKLKDFKAAELYCVNNSEGKDAKYRHNLFHALLTMYLRPPGETLNKEDYLLHAVELLNTRPSDFDATKVLEVIPPNLSVSVMEGFLRGALRNSLHKYRMTKVESALAREENLQCRFALYDLKRHSINLQEHNNCYMCKKPFLDGNFLRYPNNTIVHIECAKEDDTYPVSSDNYKSLESLKSSR